MGMTETIVARKMPNVFWTDTMNKKATGFPDRLFSCF